MTRGRRFITCAIGAAIVAAVAAPGAADQAADTSKKKDAEPVHVIQGCLAGSIISSVTTDEKDAQLVLPTGASFRLTGPRDVVKTLKREHNGHLEEFTGHVRGSFGPQGSAPTTRSVGGISVGVGVASSPSGPSASPVPSMPSFDVQSFRHLGDCGDRRPAQP